MNNHPNNPIPKTTLRPIRIGFDCQSHAKKTMKIHDKNEWTIIPIVPSSIVTAYSFHTPTQWANL